VNAFELTEPISSTYLPAAGREGRGAGRKRGRRRRRRRA